MSSHQNKFPVPIIFALAVWLLSITAIEAEASPKRAHTMSGPIKAHVVRVIDGDTIVARVKIWLDQELTVLVRLGRIDAPELRSGTPTQRQAAWKSYKALFTMTKDVTVSLHNIRRGKYSGRVIAEVFLPDGTNVSNMLISKNLARPYGKKFKVKRTARPCRLSPAAPTSSNSSNSPYGSNGSDSSNGSNASNHLSSCYPAPGTPPAIHPTIH